MAVLPPMPSASVRVTMSEKAGARRISRSPWRRSAMTDSIMWILNGGWTAGTLPHTEPLADSVRPAFPAVRHIAHRLGDGSSRRTAGALASRHHSACGATNGAVGKGGCPPLLRAQHVEGEADVARRDGIQQATARAGSPAML